jgi:hypothetical protein
MKFRAELVDLATLQSKLKIVVSIVQEYDRSWL